jgi:hypothetical protein
MMAALSDVKARRITKQRYRPVRRALVLGGFLAVCWMLLSLALIGAFALATSLNWHWSASLQNQLGRAQLVADAVVGDDFAAGRAERAIYKNAGSALLLRSRS